ncbi:hypothetical protein MKX51_12550 [Paenibacillus sp. FSL M7-0420]
MLIKVIIYAYTQRIYSSRQIANPSGRTSSSCGSPDGSGQTFVL